MNNTQKITDIHCLSCGAPADFDIVSQQYVCRYCGGKTGISEALKEKQGFRKIQRDRINRSVKDYRLFHAECSGCGADIVFEENEALAECPFCSRALVRKEYLNADNMPESILPFAITGNEARERLLAWCSENSRRTEAKKLKRLAGQMQGIYLPYELVKGPVHMNTSRLDGGNTYRCEGFIENELINRSGQLDNLLLDGMEPFDLDQLKEFDFAYAAGQRIKIADLSEKELKKRIEEEVSVSYRPYVRRVLQTQAVDISAEGSSVIRLPVLLPVYFISKDGLMAAVNGQTGKVSVRSLSVQHYYFIPWWLKAILATLLVSLIVFGGLCLFGMTIQESLLITSVLALFFIIVLLCLYSDTVHNTFAVESGREIFTSGEKTFVRERGRLVQRDEFLTRKTVPPVFFETLDGVSTPVELKFATPLRTVKVALLTMTAIFLPVIIALLINGFDFNKLELGGSAVWFCIAVPLAPVFVLKYAVSELYERPWIYILEENGRKKRYRKKTSAEDRKNNIKFILEILFTPPQCFAVWGGIAVFIFICWLTAFGF